MKNNKLFYVLLWGRVTVCHVCMWKSEGNFLSGKGSPSITQAPGSKFGLPGWAASTLLGHLFDPAFNKHSPTSAPTLTGCEGSSHSRYLEPIEEVMRYKDRREHPDVFIVQCLV